MSYRHTITVLTSRPDGDAVRRITRDALFDSEHVSRNADVILTASESATNKKRLIELAVWAAGEQAKKDLGLPSEWNQLQWVSRNGSVGGSCGTACCIAGKVVLDDGGEPAWHDGDSHTSRVLMPDGEYVWVENYAADALGITHDEAQRLFKDKNTLDDILRIIGELVGESADDD